MRKKFGLLNRSPKHDGNAFRYPAAEFIADLEKFMDEKNLRCCSRNVLLYSLEGDAKLWAKVFAANKASYAALKSAFLARFWGPDIQRRVIEDFLYGSYRQRGQQSKMGKYFLGLLNRVKNLDAVPTDQTIIATVSEHFPFHLQQQIRRKPSLEDVYNTLLELDRAITSAAKTYAERMRRNKYLRSNNTTKPRLDHDTDEQFYATTAESSYPSSCCGGRCNGTSVRAMSIHTPSSNREINQYNAAEQAVSAQPDSG